MTSDTESARSLASKLLPLVYVTAGAILFAIVIPEVIARVGFSPRGVVARKLSNLPPQRQLLPGNHI